MLVFQSVDSGLSSGMGEGQTCASYSEKIYVNEYQLKKSRVLITPL